MKRFLLFRFPEYYPAGGWGDFEAAFDTMQEAHDAALAANQHDDWQVVDLEVLKVISGFGAVDWIDKQWHK